MTQTPTDALRLVPVETLRRCAAVLADPKAEHSHDVSYLIEEVEALASAPVSPPVPWQHRQIEGDGVGGYQYAAAPASPLLGGGWLGAEHLSEAITRLTRVTAGDEIEAAYADFTFPGHTFRADVRALLSALPAAPTGEPK